jgi:ABC-type amino acid transport substrate-binding protein
MLKNLILLFFFSVTISQNEIIVYRTSANMLMNKIEEEIIINTFDLYNKKNNNLLSYKFKSFAKFGDMQNEFDLVSTLKPNSILTINRITISKEREEKYRFSSIYAPGKEVLVKRVSDKRPFQLSNRTKILYIKNTAHENSMKYLKQKYSIIPYPTVSTTEMFQRLESDKYDYGIIDNVSIWTKNNYEIVHEIEEQNGKGFGIMYPKNSKLRDKLDKYIQYYIRSSKFKILLTKSYGKEVRNYFLKAIMETK